MKTFHSRFQWLRILSTAFVGLLLVACGSTRITSENPRADIYVNSKKVGVGTALLDQVGPPKTVQVTAKIQGQTIGTTEVSRSFRLMTLVWGVCSYYTGFYWGWYYPDYVIIPQNQTYITNQNNSVFVPQSPWQQPRTSIWMQPIK